MSLINDALKRVKTAQQQQPPSSSVGPQLKPVEPTPPIRSFVGVVTPVALALVALLALFLVWELRKKNDLADAIPVRAQADHPENGPVRPESVFPNRKPDSESVRSSAASPETSSQIPVAAAPLSSSNAGDPTNALRSPDNDRAESRTVTGLNQSSGAVQKLPSTNQVTVAAAADGVILGPNQTDIPNSISNNVGTNDAPPKPAPLKLQGIVWDPKRPSAVINGRTVFVGDRLRQMRVIAITAETATLVDSSHTNVLSMAE